MQFLINGEFQILDSMQGDVSPEEIIQINKGRWEIEETFRILKSEFQARPVYLQKETRIKAHFLTCFLSLLMYRILEKKLDEGFTCPELVSTLRNMNMRELDGEGYIPAYTRTKITDALHDAFGFRTDFEIVTQKDMKKFLNKPKKGNSTQF